MNIEFDFFPAYVLRCWVFLFLLVILLFICFLDFLLNPLFDLVLQLDSFLTLGLTPFWKPDYIPPSFILILYLQNHSTKLLLIQSHLDLL